MLRKEIESILENVTMLAHGIAPDAPWGKGTIEYLKKSENYIIEAIKKDETMVNISQSKKKQGD